MRSPTFDDVEAAAARLSKFIEPSPVITCADLDDRLGRPVFLKCENLQLTGSFKIRGALNRMLQLEPHEREHGVVAFSSGNHAQGIARAGRLLGISVVIVMPNDAPRVKPDGVRQDGGEIVFYDRVAQDREAIARSIANDTGRILVPSFDDPDIIAGQGTVGLEFVKELDRRDVGLSDLICCVGGGGLIAGIGLAFGNQSPDTRVWGAEPDGHDDHRRSLESGERIANPPGFRSICDALLSDAPGQLTFEINRRTLSGVYTVSDDEVLESMGYAVDRLKVIVEPGGCAALAAALSNVNEGKGPLGIVLTGGNVSPEVLKMGIDRWLAG